MAAKLEWRGNVLTLSGVALYIGVAEYEESSCDGPASWQAYGDASYGSLLDDTWENETDAKQDVMSEVRRLLREAGIEVMP